MKNRRAVEFANEIRLLQNERESTVLIVEGRDDRLLMEKFIDPDACRILVVENKTRVEDVIQILDDERRPGVLGLVDADFDRITRRPPVSHNIVMPDGHDIESMLMRCPALDNVWVEFGSKEKIVAFRTDPFETIDRIAQSIGCLRLYSIRSSANLTFKGIRVSKFIDRRSFQIDLGKFLSEIKKRSQQHLDDARLLTAIAEIDAEGHESAQLSNGSDLIAILSYGLRRTFGSNNATDVSETKLRASLRLAYHRSDFENSRLFRDIRHWELHSDGFRILA